MLKLVGGMFMEKKREEMKKSNFSKNSIPRCSKCGSRNIRYTPLPMHCNKCGTEGGLELFHKVKK